MSRKAQEESKEMLIYDGIKRINLEVKKGVLNLAAASKDGK